ncbi:MAG: NAD-glutamate dehydrogenase [Alphaproteobacteria bacterium]
MDTMDGKTDGVPVHGPAQTHRDGAAQSSAALPVPQEGTGHLVVGQIASREASHDFAKFVRLLFERADADDLAAYDADILLGIARSIWDLLEQRRSGERIVRVFNPDQMRDRFNGVCTVMQVVSDDMPFIIDSVLGELAALDLPIRRILHPILETRRDADGNRLHVEASTLVPSGTPAERLARESGYVKESILHVEVDRHTDPVMHREIERGIESVLADVARVVEDWQPMRSGLLQAIDDLSRNAPFRAPGLEKGEFDETQAFLKWLLDEHFAFLGMRDYEIVGGIETGDLRVKEETGLGLLADPDMRVLRRQGELAVMTPEVRDFLRSPQPIIVSKANVRSRVHRRVFMDYIGIKRYGPDGSVLGERRIVGLFTAVAYNRSTWDVPLLARKVALVMEKARLPMNAHDERAMVNILETFPRDELFQASVDEILKAAIGVLRLQKRPHTKIFVRHDRFDRFVAVLVYVLRDKYDTNLRIRIGELLADRFNGQVQSFYPAFGDSPLTRVYFIIGRNVGEPPEVDLAEIEARIEAFTRDWAEDLRVVLAQRHGPARGRELGVRYAGGFSAAYRDHFGCATACQDIDIIEALGAYPQIGLYTYRNAEDPVSAIHLKSYHWDVPLPLSDCLPILENMGLRVVEEVPYAVEVALESGLTRAGEDAGGRTVWIHDFFMTHVAQWPIDLDAIEAVFAEAFRAVCFERAENDGFNRLVVEQAMPWQDVMVLRALARYRKQAGSTFSESYIVTALSNQGHIARMLVDLFRCKFDPAMARNREAREGRQIEIEAGIEEALEKVASLDTDRIIRQFLNLIQSALRTNFYQRIKGEAKPYLSIKFASREIFDLPEPRPRFEIFVYSPRFEGVHLRGGLVARGGIRWSDRPEDFRAEILGLVKAQQVKNAVIVPVGAKGGFVPKRLPTGHATRDAIIDEAVASYRLFISGLLDLTDNLDEGGVIPAHDVVAYDGPDPYLVVAADKGTAAFSDIANAVAADYGHWLGDAFASGGRAGYDHKKMGITAKGAWEAVKRHFRELGTDIQTTPFTVVGIGDMSGDVFGNGMLLSTKTRLVAAFDHRDIFLDPNPDPARSYAERQRMFALPRASWQDYDRDAISHGGGVFSRQRKSIPLSLEVQAALGITKTAMTPTDLIRAILMAPVDLLWFGGIGTYVKSSGESNFDVADRANDALRLNADQLRARVVGEGANLGVTQLGRIAYARGGGRINTDSVDNAGGVDCSDHEVNIKVALASVVASGALSPERRDVLLEDMTDDVAALVLRNNYDQTLALSVAQKAGAEDFDAHSRLMRWLERHAGLVRTVEFLPDEESLEELKEYGEGLTRPEIAILMAYTKTKLFDTLLASDVPDDPWLEQDLIRYFPAVLGERYRGALAGHRLRREIIATVLANDLVNKAGITMIHRIEESMGIAGPEIARGYVISREIFGLPSLQDRINGLDLEVPTDVQVRSHRLIIDFMRRQVPWFLRYRPMGLDIGPVVEAYRGPVLRLAAGLEDMLSPFEAQQLESHLDQGRRDGLEETIARPLALLEPLSSATDIIDVARNWNWTPEATGAAYFAVGAALNLDRLRFAAKNLTSEEHWDRLAIKRAVDDLFRQQRFLVNAAIGAAIDSGLDHPDGQTVAENWLAQNDETIVRVNTLIADMTASGPLTGAKLALAGSQIRDLMAGLG